MTTADEFRSTVRALQAGQITVVQARGRNRELRERLGDAEYDRAKRAAVVAIARGQ